MKKLILFTALPLFLFASSELEQKVIELENDIKSIKTLIEDDASEMSEYIPILEKIETKSILDKINLSPELKLHTAKMHYQNNGIEGEETRIDGDPTKPYRRQMYSKDFNPAVFIKFKLNMSANLDDKVKFNGRMIFANTTQSYQRLCILSRDIKSSTSSSAFDIDRAYFDYTQNKHSENSFTFTFGLLPTSGGTPMQFAQNETRKSMFPALVFDMNTYGLIGTQKFKDDTFIRAIAAKAYTLRANFYPYQCNRENIDNAGVFGAYIDTKFDFLGKSLFSFGVNLLHDFKAHPYLGPDIDSSNSHVLGDMATFGAGLDIENIAETGSTIFIHTAISDPHGNGAIDDYKIVNLVEGTTESNTTGFSVADYAKGTMLTQRGYAIYVGAKFDLTDTINFGAEYNYGSKYWFSATQGAEDMFNKLAVRGHVGEAYASWSFHENIYTKLGYLHSVEQYTGSGWHFGEPAKKDALQRVAYLSFNAKF